MAKPVIAWDSDDTIFPMALSILAYFDAKEGTSYALTAEPNTYNMPAIWGLSEHEAWKRIEEFLSSDHSTIELLPGAEKALGRLSHRFRHEIVTSRPDYVRANTEAYYRQRLPQLISDIHMAVYDPVTELPITRKLDVCREIGAVALVDDHLMHVLDAAASGLPCVLFGDYPWNQHETLPDDVVRANSWAEVEAALDHLLGSV